MVIQRIGVTVVDDTLKPEVEVHVVPELTEDFGGERLQFCYLTCEPSVESLYLTFQCGNLACCVSARILFPLEVCPFVTKTFLCHAVDGVSKKILYQQLENIHIFCFAMNVMRFQKGLIVQEAFGF